MFVCYHIVTESAARSKALSDLYIYILRQEILRDVLINYLFIYLGAKTKDMATNPSE